MNRNFPDGLLVVEGEKCAKAAEKVFSDWLVVTSPGGANAAAKADWTPLQNRQVVIWPDADEAGATYSNDVASILHGLGVPVRIVDVHALASRTAKGTTREPPPGWDVADATDEGWDFKALREAAEEVAKPWADPTGTNGTNGKGSYGEKFSSPEVNAWEHPDLGCLGTGRSVPP
jgi:hypothetical protein